MKFDTQTDPVHGTVLGGNDRPPWQSSRWPVCFSELPSSTGLRLDGAVAKYWETVVEKLEAAGWEVHWVEAMRDGETRWTAIAIRGKERHSIHANDRTLALQELEANCARAPIHPVVVVIPIVLRQ